MKKILLVAVATMMSTSVYASKARLAALQGAAHVGDVQRIFTNPANAAAFGEWGTFEFGQGATSMGNAGGYNTTTAGHEGGFVKAMGSNYAGIYFGHKSNAIALSRGTGNGFTAGTVLTEENPFEIYFAQKGEMTWGASLFYSNSDKKGPAGSTSTPKKQNTMGARVGAMGENWDGYFQLGLANNAKTTSAAGVDSEVKGKMSALLGGSYTLDKNLFIYGSYSMTGFKSNIGSTDATDWDVTLIDLGVINTHKKDGTDFYYGISYHMDTLKQKQGASAGKSEATYLPFIVGVEHDVNSWLILRTSITQNFFMGGYKDETSAITGTATTESNTYNDSTTVAAGVGLKFNKLMLDATLKAAQNGGNLGTDGGSTSTTANATSGASNNFLGMASLTYMF